MKHIATLFLALAALPTLTAPAAAQAAPIPSVTSVPQRKSFEPNQIAVLGSNLGLASSVRVNGVEVPILRVTASRLVAGPVDPQLPGFGLVELIHGRGVVGAPIELVPTLTAVRRGTRLNMVLNNGDTGVYTLRYNHQALGSPVLDQNVYGPRYLPFGSPVLVAGVFADANPLALTTLMPLQIGQLGIPMRLQAQCTSSTFGVDAYTNLAVVPGFGTNPLP